MTDATVLADALVEKIGAVKTDTLNFYWGNEGEGPYYCLPGVVEFMGYKRFITDWRVAGRCLESMYDWHWNIFADSVSAAPNNTWGLPDEDHRAHADECESLPRAIIEAWYEAQNND